MVGVVEDTNDPKRMGRVKVRIERLHGRVDDTNKIPTEDLPWCDISVRGTHFTYPRVGKVVSVSFENDDYYNPTITNVLHYDVNLQERLQSLDDEHYAGFYANTFNAKHQYYHDIDEGIMFDYVKSNMNFRPNGDIRVNLRDNKANLYLGTEDADQQAMLGNHWMDFFDELVQNLLGSKGGPYLGNMGAPVLPNPGMLEILNKYLALRETFLSDRVYIVDDNMVKEQDRAYDIEQSGDAYNDENFDKASVSKTEGYKPESRPQSGGNPSTGDIKPNNYSTNLSSSKLPEDATPEEKKRDTKPFDDGVGNGKIPVENMTVNSFLRDSFPDESDERKYLLDEPSKALDSFLKSYNSEKSADWGTMVVTKGYQNFERQENARKQYPSKAPVAGKDPFGFGNQVELYWGIDKSNKDVTDRINSYLRNGNTINPNNERMPEEESLDWLVKNAPKYKWRLAGRTATGSQQWWHWIYDATVIPTPPISTPPVNTSNSQFNPVSFDRVNFGSGSVYSSGSTKTFNVDLNQSQGEWKIIGLEYSYKSDGEEGSGIGYDSGIKNNGKKVIVDIEDFIENELDLTVEDIKFSNLDLTFKVTVDPIANGSLDSSRNQVIKSDKFVIRARK
jgi:hypothetical protein